MFNIKKVNESPEFLAMSSYHSFILDLTKRDTYISQKNYISEYNKNNDVYTKLRSYKNDDILRQWCKKTKTNYKDIVVLMDFFKDSKDFVNNFNKEYVNRHLVEDKEYLDEVLSKDDPSIKLDDMQRSVVLKDEDYTLVVAGAGAGKTTTIEAKVKYLVDKKHLNPDRIFVVSFTKKATNELKERFKKLGVLPQISTFHSLGFSLISKNNENPYKIASNGFMFSIIRNYLTNKLDDEYFIKKVLLFFASYIMIPFKDDEISKIFKNLSDNENVTLKSDLKQILEKYQEEQTSNKITIKDERVRSIDECRIANFLYINGVDYEYEPVYRYNFIGSIKPYCPDFVINQDGKKIYFEHFGISQSGNNSRFSQEELELYKKHINDKITLHKQHGTQLIYTFSKYNDGRDLIVHLKEELDKAGIKLNTVDQVQIYRQIAEKAQDKYFNKLIMLICRFISRFKTDNFSLSKFDERKVTIKNERTRLFLDICYQCYLEYGKVLKEENAIDFEDMINYAINILDEKILNNDKLPYDYIFVDEYQDISMQRFSLSEKFSRVCDAKIIAVGDDWQSIYRFSGSQINLFTEFVSRVGYGDIIKITNTYRNSQELIDIAGNFVMRNDKQIKKMLKSPKNVEEPVILMSYDDSYSKAEDKRGPFYRLGEAIEKSLDNIVLHFGVTKNVLILVRFNFEKHNLSTLEDFFEFEGDNLKSKKYPNIKISCLTAHSSKGLGFDNVIIINGKDDVLGFPSKIEDDPVMSLVLENTDNYDYAEERRLFYVALTRTKNRVYIIVPQHKPSQFVTEIKDSFTNIILRGPSLSNELNDKIKLICPVCGYPLQKRTNHNFSKNKKGLNLYICSNDPEVCGYMTNDITGGLLSICKCPKCNDGYLIVKKIKDSNKCDTGRRMLGCTNYKADGTGCNFTIVNDDYSSKELEIKRADNSKLVSDIYDMCYLGIPLKDLLNSIVKVFERTSIKCPNFLYSYKSLKDLLMGITSVPIKKFKLYELEEFGIIDEKYNFLLNKLFFELQKEEIIVVSDDQYKTLCLNNKMISDQLIREIYVNLK